MIRWSVQIFQEGTRSRRGWRHTISGAAIAVIVTAPGCLKLPGIDKPDDRDAALGSVTISTPLFTPFTDALGDSKRLTFGDLRNEAKLADRVQVPSVGLTLLQYEALRTALAVDVAGPKISSTLTDTKSIEGGAETTKSEFERTRSFETPAVPDTAPTPPGVGAEDKLLALLERSGRQFQLPPDQLATLVATYKAFMINLEEYYNVEAYTNIFTDDRQWDPYKVHFTASVSPGWYSQAARMDGVARLTFCSAKAESCSKDTNFRVLTVIPTEAAQTLDEMAAAFRSLATAAELGAAFESVGAKAQFDAIQAAAQRLEGLRSNTTMVVGYPATNQVEIRFRPSIVADGDETGLDLQPTTRLVTALVMVRRSVSDESPSAPSAVSAAAPADGTTRSSDNNKPRTTYLSSNSPLQATGASKDAAKVAAPAEAMVEVKGHFQPSLDIGDDSHRAPRETAVFKLASQSVRAEVPVWPAANITPFGIAAASGYYWRASVNQNAKAVIGARVTNPTQSVVVGWVSGTNDEGGESVCEELGVGAQQATLVVDVPAPARAGDALRVFLNIAQGATKADACAKKDSRKIREVTLAPQAIAADQPPSAPMISIDRHGIGVSPTPISELPPELLRLMIGEQKNLDVQLVVGSGKGNAH